MRIRTGFSFRSAVGMVDDVVSRLKEVSYPRAVISDKANTFGFVDFTKAAAKKEMDVVYGLELAVTPSVNLKKPIVDHWTFIALDEIEALNVLMERASEQFRYEPLLTYKQAMEAEGVIKLVGHRALFEEFEPQRDLFVVAAPSAVPHYLRTAIERGHALIAGSDNRFPRPEDAGLYEIICGRNANIQTYDQWILSRDEWLGSVSSKIGEKETKLALKNFDKQIIRPTAALRKGEMLHPKRPKTLRAMCIEGAKKIGCDLSSSVYRERLDRELKLIKEKDFEDYFYIIADVVQWSRDHLLVGPARGSSCGSLVCYLLRITTIDPIKYGLIFERFIDVNRADLPDIDIDFSDQKRQLVFDYMKEKYGADRTARLGTVAVYKPRSAISEAGAALKIPRWKCEAALESLIERSSGDSRALQALEDTFKDTLAGKELIRDYPEIDVATKMEGHPRHYSQHAAGVLLTEKPTRHYVAVDIRTGGTHCDKKDAEYLNLLKIDMLGLTQLSIFEDALELAGKDHNFLETVPLNDKKAFDVLNAGKFAGIFQFNGQALQSLVKQIKVDDVEDFISITALARPGPMTTGAANRWVERKNGIQKVEYPHPLFKKHLEGTLGIVIYQEQVMTIGREIGDLSWEDVSKLRRAMSQTLGVEFFDQFGNPWKKGAAAKGVPANLLDQLWQDLCAFGAMGFNRSHAVAYGIISYWCAWLKAHFPYEFAAATLTHETDPAKQIKLLRELDAEGIKYRPVDPALSTDRWQTSGARANRVLVGPIQNVKGIGPKKVATVLACRARNLPLPDAIAKQLKNPVTSIDSLWPVRDAFHRILPDPTAKNIHSEPVPVSSIVPTDRDRDVLIFGVFVKINPRDENEIGLVNKRGGKKIEGETAFLNLQIADDTDTIFGKVSRWDYERVGRGIVDRGSPGKCLYAIKGKLKGGMSFRMVQVKNVRFIGTLNEEAMEIDLHNKPKEEEE